MPSEQILAAIARGLHLTINERDHLYQLAATRSRAVPNAPTTSTRD